MAHGEVYEFGEFTLAATERRLLRCGRVVRLPPRTLDVLLNLVRHRGCLLTKDTLLSMVWPGSFVEEGGLTVHISALRRALGDDKCSARFIETVAGAGYRFIAAVTMGDSDDAVVTPTATRRPAELFELVGAGRMHVLSGSSHRLPAAEAAFRSAIELDRSYAPAYAGLALTRCSQAINQLMPHRVAYADAKDWALRALAMDSASADAQVALGAVLFMSEWDWHGAERSLRRALDHSPDHSEALLQYGALADALGEPSAGLAYKQQALERAPDSPLVQLEVALSYALARNFEAALRWARKALEGDPANRRVSDFILATSWFLGDLEGVFAEKRRRATVSEPANAAVPNDVSERAPDTSQLGSCSARAAYLLKQLANLPGSRGCVLRGAVYARAGDPDAAFGELDRALAERDPFLVYLRTHVIWDPLRADVRFQERLRTLAMPVTITLRQP